MKTFSISVGDFALPVPRVGSIEPLSGFGGKASQLGIELHQKIQLQRSQELGPIYKPEEKIVQTFERDGFAFEIVGRMDGFYDEKTPKIEEIKSAFNIYELFRKLKDNVDTHPYCLQLRTYGYFYWLQKNKVPQLTMHLVSTRNGDTMDFDVHLNVVEFERWLNLRLEELVGEAKAEEKRLARREKAGKNLAFPFQNPREGQIDLIRTVEDGMSEGRPMLIQAPTGLGKTIGVMYPTLKEALGRGQKVIYITPKNSQHAVAEDAVARLQETGASIKSLTITAKSKMCMKNEPLCNPEYCEFAKDHYTKVAANGLLKELSKKKSLKAKTFKKMAEDHQVCPFELQLDAAQDVDAVICDYNYVFAPRSAFGRIAGGGFQQKGKPNLVIDEAHNLPARTMDYYSPSLSAIVLENMREEIRDLPAKFRLAAELLLDDCIAVVKACQPKETSQPSRIDPPVESFLEQDMQLRAFLSTYLKADIDIQPRDVVMRLSFYWSEFTEKLEFISSGREEFFTTFYPQNSTIKITCCDASEMLKDCYQDYDQVVGFSATLKPFEFYSRLAGLHDKDLKTAEFVSPFPKEHRKLLLIPQVSSKFSERQRNYPRVAEVIQKVAELKRGNYFAFFPSFEFMERVLELMPAMDGFTYLKQSRHMSKDDVEAVMERLAMEDYAHIVFAVQGGIFSEGVDYPGKMAIGAFIVGPPLPSFDLEREIMREYYEDNYSAGFDYTYTYPAMAKAVQAAGRVIRSETDQGIIVLMDNRFAQPSFAKSMPQDWFESSPRELVSDRILQDVREFWDESSLGKI